MKRILPLLVALALPFFWLSPAHAQNSNALVVSACGGVTYPANANRQTTQDTTGRLCDSNAGWTGPTPPPTPSSLTGTVQAKTITNTSAQVLAAAARTLLAVDNESATATIACAFGAVAAINTAGSFTILPGNTRTWVNYPIPTEALNCISSAATSPATVEVY